MNKFKIERYKLEVEKENVNNKIYELNEQLKSLEEYKKVYRDVINETYDEIVHEIGKKDTIRFNNADVKEHKGFVIDCSKPIISMILLGSAVLFLPNIIFTIFGISIISVGSLCEIGLAAKYIIKKKKTKKTNENLQLEIKKMNEVVDLDTKLKLTKEELKPIINRLGIKIDFVKLRIKNAKNELLLIYESLNKLDDEEEKYKKNYIQEGFDRHLVENNIVPEGKFNTGISNSIGLVASPTNVESMNIINPSKTRKLMRVKK